MGGKKVTVQETAEDRQAWLEAAEMHRVRAEVIDKREQNRLHRRERRRAKENRLT